MKTSLKTENLKKTHTHSRAQEHKTATTLEQWVQSVAIENHIPKSTEWLDV